MAPANALRRSGTELRRTHTDEALPVLKATAAAETNPKVSIAKVVVMRKMVVSADMAKDWCVR